jgi:hypothetical protein
VEAEGGRVTVVARRHRISASLLYNWEKGRISQHLRRLWFAEYHAGSRTNTDRPIKSLRTPQAHMRYDHYAQNTTPRTGPALFQCERR